MRLRTLRLVLLACIGIAGPHAFAAPAEGLPAQSVRLVVPFPPGGSTDAIARILAEGLAKELGESVYIDNRPGAATNIGSEWVAKARPDGYTLLFGSSALLVNQIFGPKPGFDPQEGLAPISTVAEVPFVLAAHPDAPFRTPREFVLAARHEPGRLSVASSQLDTYVERLMHVAGVELLHVPYKGGAQAVTDTMSGVVDSTFALVPVLLPLLEAGKLRAIGITSPKRLKDSLPDVPTFVESGVDFIISALYVLQGPVGMEPERVERLNSAVRAVATSGSFKSRLKEIGAKASSSSPEELTELLRKQSSAWEKLAKDHPELLKSR